MSNEIIDDHILSKKARQLAKEIFSEAVQGMSEDETPEDYRDDMMDRAHETADGHEWVIYTYKAHRLCLYCDTTMGEEFLDDVGLPGEPTYDGLASTIAFGELRGRIMQELEEMIEEYESAEGDEA